jgi:hypothetical protein
MKNRLLKTGSALMVCFLIACSGNSPKSVAENFLKAMNKMDFEGAKKYGTEDTNKMLDMLSGFAKMMPDSAKKEVKTEIVSEKVEGDKATYTYKEKDKEEEQTIHLVKVDGKWKVAMSKDDMNSGAGDQNTMDSGATTTDTTSVPAEK